MVIQGSLPPSSRIPGRLPVGQSGLLDRVTLSGPDSNPPGSAASLWRDFGINPLAMARRLTVDLPAPGGSGLKGAQPAHPLVMEWLRGQLGEVVAGVQDLATLKQDLTRVAGDFGVEIDFRPGTPHRELEWAGSPGSAR
jgi:hypothetical protein